MALMFAVSGFLLYVTKERNSGTKSMLIIMGLDNTTYWMSQILSFLIETSLLSLGVSIAIACQIAAQTDRSISGVYAFFGWFLTLVNLGPFLFTISSLLISDKLSGAMSNMLKYIVPMAPLLVMVQNINQETASSRFFLCLIPPMNFMFVLRDALKQVFTPEPIICLLINFPFWCFFAWYLDIILPTATTSSRKQPCFCFFTCFNSNQDENLVLSDVASRGHEEKSLIVIKNLQKQFGNFKAVDGLSLNIEEGTIYGLLGFNGAGKTTTINIISGLLKPSGGDVKLNGYSVRTDMHKIRKHLGMCPQHNIMFDLLTIGEHLLLFGRLKGMNDDEISRQTKMLLESLNLQHQVNCLAKNLSGGQKRMLCMVQAFLGNPKVILLDEPTSGVDSESRRAMWNFIMKAKEGRAIILTTHQMREADVLCDKIGIMSEGKLLVEGDSVTLKQRYSVGYQIDITHDEKFKEKDLDFVRESIPSAKTNCRSDDVFEINVPAKFQTKLPELIEKLEDSDGVKHLNVHAATLNSVFLNLAQRVEEGKAIDRRESEDQKDVESIKVDSCEIDNVKSRPNICFQILLLTMKRFYITFLYWSPILSGIIQVCILATIIMSLLTIANVNGGNEYMKVSEAGKIAFVTDDGLSSDLQNHFSSADASLYSYTDWEANANIPRERTIEEHLIIVNHDGKTSVYAEPFHIGYIFLAIQSLTTDVKEFVLGNTNNGISLTEVLTPMILILGMGLIMGASWFYIGKEFGENLLQFQAQMGTPKILIWLSNYIFDVGLNMMFITIFISIAITTGQKLLVSLYLYNAFLAILGYVFIQYICVYTFRRAKTIETLLSWSALMQIGIFFVEIFMVIPKETRGDDLLKLLFEPDKDLPGDARFRIAQIINYLFPVCQFMIGCSKSFVVVILDLYANEDSTMAEEKDKLMKHMYGERLAYSILAALFWGFVLFSLNIYHATKKDPLHIKQNRAIPADVQAEKERVDKLMEAELDKDELIVGHRLTKIFSKNGGSFAAVDDLTFSVRRGECFGLLGRNGAGKTTAMNMLTTNFAPSSGSVLLSGLSSVREMRKIIGICPQHECFWEQVTVFQHLFYFGLLKGVSTSDIRKHIHILCEALTLDPYYSRAVGKLSGGNKRKLMLATSLIGASEVVFMDEPSAGVDPFARKKMMDVLQKYKSSRAMVLTTHMMEETSEICDKVGIMVNVIKVAGIVTNRKLHVFRVILCA